MEPGGGEREATETLPWSRTIDVDPLLNMQIIQLELIQISVKLEFQVAHCLKLSDTITLITQPRVHTRADRRVLDAPSTLAAEGCG